MQIRISIEMRNLKNLGERNYEIEIEMAEREEEDEEEEEEGDKFWLKAR